MPLLTPASVDGALDGVAAGLRHDVHRRSADFRFAEAAGRRERDFLRVADVGDVARHAAAVERRADAEAVHLQAAFVAAPARRRRTRPCPGVTCTSARRRPGLTAGIELHERAVARATSEATRSRRRSTVVCRRTLCTSTIGVSPVTVIVSSSVPTRRSALTVRRERAGQLDAFALDGAEAGQRERHGVGARPQIDDAVLAGAVGDGGADFLDQHRAGRFDGDAGQHGAGASLTTPVIDAWA